MWLRLKFIFDRVKATHKTKEKVLDGAPCTQLLPLTINHIEETNPNSNQRGQHQLRNMTLDRVGNKGEFVLFQDNALQESVRAEVHEQAVSKTGMGPNNSSPLPLRQKLFEKNFKLAEAQFRLDPTNREQTLL